MRFVSTLFLVVIAACTTTTSARGTQEPSTRMVSVDGQQVLAEDVAASLFSQAQQANEPATKKTLLRRVVDEFADTQARGPATVELARLLLDEKQAHSAQEAQAALERLLLEDPTSPAAGDARALLAMTQLAASRREGGTSGSAAPQMKSIVDK